MSDNNLTLFGLPVVVVDAAPKDEILLGRLPTWAEVIEHGSLESAIKAQGREWAKAKLVESDD